MYELVTLTKNNINDFNKLNGLKSNFNKLNRDFFKVYHNQNGFQQFLQKRKVKLLKKNSDYIGYIWSENIRDTIYKIEAINVINDIQSLEIYRLLINSIKLYSKIYYECEKNEYNFTLLKDLGFNKTSGMIEMTLNLDNFILPPSHQNITFQKLIKGKDEKLRCSIQNRIFEREDRIPLDIDDIYYDELQSYYYDDGAIFIKNGNTYIGYGQIIIKESVPYIVNFGLVKEWQNKGYGKLLLSHLLNILHNNSYKIVKIKVDPNNYTAIKLYKYFGFTKEKEIYTWILCK
ncbi:GNAT family N-acetyltransferase [Clostridium ganghwense]|uniref:GNAT family N-acetyltransferase n=1 Tax=Clostridium ganghwense TaxID=312089 RepID=A0ABT4CU33_9CLOT|nr:GNAT family N-acetyltransferase [Clostridium ganghwense]MCY6372547.1 GNAT family N-acetyltransferase [Clostridium ganghwense]